MTDRDRLIKLHEQAFEHLLETGEPDDTPWICEKQLRDSGIDIDEIFGE